MQIKPCLLLVVIAAITHAVPTERVERSHIQDPLSEDHPPPSDNVPLPLKNDRIEISIVVTDTSNAIVIVIATLGIVSLRPAGDVIRISVSKMDSITAA
ncbi:hypothetical protein AJ80_06568 [Polytolypa hystricis UAMH7299]|uniref:Uncharacterized protein n=1 Tax=Polytolypa hystricis (strain UAMH7299) TaxID=1447883 RepID=A0A2B7XV64_POLH7|nr:hypothetical protein AJ80_06568 [Polytolypa hystricis UAMH7299]